MSTCGWRSLFSILRDDAAQGPWLKPFLPWPLFVGLKPHAPSEEQEQGQQKKQIPCGNDKHRTGNDKGKTNTEILASPE
jgi:hypothetical protein